MATEADARWTRRDVLSLAARTALAARFAAGKAALASDTLREPAWYASMIENRFSTARRYSFDATIEIARKEAEGPREQLGLYQVKLAVAPDHRLLFRVGARSSLQYLIACDGSRTWAVVPESGQYVELDAVVSLLTSDPDVAFSSGMSRGPFDPLLLAGLVFPVLARLRPDAASVVDMKRLADPEAAEDDRVPPVLTVLSGTPEGGDQRLTELTLNPETLLISRMNWTKSVSAGGEPVFAFLTSVFSRLELDSPLPASYFSFAPGSAQRVETLTIPGIDATALTGKPAPDFEVGLPEGRKTRLSQLRGRTVLIVFSPEDCLPCKRQAGIVAGLQADYRTRGLVVLNVGDGYAGVHSRYGVRFAPTLALVGGDGKLLRILPGLQNGEAIRTLLNQAGI